MKVGLTGFSLSLLVALVVAQGVAMAAGNGQVSSGPCPLSCKSLGIPKKVCRDWREGGTCYVEDLRNRPSSDHADNQPPANKKGHVTVSPCPHSCQTRGIPKNICRDWREGNACYVEDLSQAPGFTNNMPENPPPRLPRPVDRPVFTPIPRPPDQDHNVECDPKSDRYIARPRVDIYSIKRTGSFFKDHYKVRGAVEGVCIVEAGYFEKGHKAEEIPTVRTESFRRYEFEVIAQGDRQPEIRVYNLNGDPDVYEIVPDNYDDDY